MNDANEVDSDVDPEEGLVGLGGVPFEVADEEG